jgi:hypothetical protein
LEQVTGGKKEKFMSKTKKYTDAPADIADELENFVAIEDFLPSPESIAKIYHYLN